MESNKIARRHQSNIINRILKEIPPVEKNQATKKMLLASFLNNLIIAKGWDSNEFAKKMKKQPSEINEWLSGTYDFTVDKLREIALLVN